MVISNRVNGALGRGLSSLIPLAHTRKQQPETEAAGALEVPVSEIQSNPHQPRKTADESSLQDLVSSIREHGILQPLIVVKAKAGYQLIAGERRLQAAKIIGLKTVPAVVRDVTTQQQLELALVENVQRKDLNPMERAHAYHKLIEEFGLTQEQVGKRVGKSRATIANTLRLLELPPEVQAALAEEKISEGHAKVIASAATSQEQLRLLREMLERGLSVRAGAAARRAVRARKFKPADPNLIAAEEELRSVFATRVRIDRKGKTGTITIEFYSDEELQELLKRLRRT